MNRLTNLAGVIIGVIGILIAFYLHYSNKETKELSYYILPESYKVFDKELITETNSFSLLQNDSLKIEESVYLTTFSIWNTGNQPIPPTDVRKDLEVLFSGIDKILDLKILKTIEPEVSKFQLTRVSDSVVGVKWKYSDPKDGVKFQMLYLGESYIIPKIEGKILETTFNEFKINKKVEIVSNIMSAITVMIFLFVLMIIISLFFNKTYLPIRVLYKLYGQDLTFVRQSFKKSRLNYLYLLGVYTFLILLDLYLRLNRTTEF
ncbi:hypothetical protein [Aquimarina intermedia]|uniref:Uncharacterized protein n=1 Tax=Aquimarina intermedia TaxID=350814 RepID=A0A5S5BWZ7_9FLAO|nr:hypothetical protein [Aquimarina intermedia]TYP71499.1 hypothetical protein BD809_10981 [Aquimarina intermedia]